MMDADDRLTTALADDLDGAFDALVVAHQDRLYTIALRMLGDAGDAEEAAQDALVRAYRALASYDRTRIRRAAAARLADDDRPQPLSVGRRASRDPRADGRSRSTATRTRPAIEPEAPDSGRLRPRSPSATRA